MIVVSDTTSLNYLIRLGFIEILEELYERVIVPERVILEMRHAAAPTVVREWALHPPPWLEVRTVMSPATTPRLDPGERDAIAVALEIGADLFLTDDKKARRAAEDLGLVVTGTLAILGAASGRRRLDYADTVTRLMAFGFRASEWDIEYARPGRENRKG